MGAGDSWRHVDVGQNVYYEHESRNTVPILTTMTTASVSTSVRTMCVGVVEQLPLVIPAQRLLTGQKTKNQKSVCDTAFTLNNKHPTSGRKTQAQSSSRQSMPSASADTQQLLRLGLENPCLTNKNAAQTKTLTPKQTNDSS